MGTQTPRESHGKPEAEAGRVVLTERARMGAAAGSGRGKEGSLLRACGERGLLTRELRALASRAGDNTCSQPCPSAVGGSSGRGAPGSRLAGVQARPGGTPPGTQAAV